MKNEKWKILIGLEKKKKRVWLEILYKYTKYYDESTVNIILFLGLTFSLQEYQKTFKPNIFH